MTERPTTDLSGPRLRPRDALPDPKQFYRHIEAVLDGIPIGLTLRPLAERIGPRVLDQFTELLGWRVVQLYDRAPGGYRLTCTALNRC